MANEIDVLSAEVVSSDAQVYADIHQRIEIHMSLVHTKTGRKLTKPQAASELLDKATKHIKVPA